MALDPMGNFLKTGRLYLLLCLMMTSKAFACSCNTSDADVEDVVASAFRASSIVVVAEVTNRTKNWVNWYGEEVQGIRLTPKIHRAFKGNSGIGTFIMADTPLSEATCGTPYEMGALLIVYGEGALPIFISQCDKTGPLIDLVEHIPQLLRLSKKEQVNRMGSN